ncbi:MAG TPA: oligosaccharide flippase family protein [Actinomycetota bacterium]|nr:oligosaccharide flippase family protein [Actinomycetota bacterium]
MKGHTPSSTLSPEAAADVRAIAGGGGLQIFGQLIPRGLSLLFTGVAVRILGAAGYGVYRQVSQILTVGGTVGAAGFEYAVVKEVAAARTTGEHGRVRGSIRTAVIGAGVVSTLVMIGLLLWAPNLAGAFAERAPNAETLTFLLRIGAPFIPLFALSQVLRYATHPYRSMIPSVVVGHIVRPMSRFLIGVAALAAGFAVTGAVLSLVVSAAAGLVAAIWYVRRAPTDLEREAIPTSRIGSLVSFAFLQGTAALLSVQTLGLGIIILGLYRSNAEVGLFAVALSLLAPVNILFTGIAPIWAPVVTDLIEKKEIDRLEELFQTVNRWLSTFGFPVLAALIVQPDVFLKLLAGRSGGTVESVVIVLALGHFFYVGTGPTSFILSMSGYPGINLAYSLLSVLICIGLGVLVVPNHGMFGMAWVMAIVTLVGNLARLIHVKALIGIQPFGKTFFKPVFATLVAVVPMVVATLFESLAADAVGLFTAAVLYLIVLRSLGIDPQERHVFDELKKRLPRRRSSAG